MGCTQAGLAKYIVSEFLLRPPDLLGFVYIFVQTLIPALGLHDVSSSENVHLLLALFFAILFFLSLFGESFFAYMRLSSSIFL